MEQKKARIQFVLSASSSIQQQCIALKQGLLKGIRCAFLNQNIKIDPDHRIKKGHSSTRPILIDSISDTITELLDEHQSILLKMIETKSRNVNDWFNQIDSILPPLSDDKAQEEETEDNKKMDPKETQSTSATADCTSKSDLDTFHISTTDDLNTDNKTKRNPLRRRKRKREVVEKQPDADNIMLVQNEIASNPFMDSFDDDSPSNKRRRVEMEKDEDTQCDLNKNEIPSISGISTISMKIESPTLLSSSTSNTTLTTTNRSISFPESCDVSDVTIKLNTMIKVDPGMSYLAKDNAEKYRDIMLKLAVKYPAIHFTSLDHVCKATFGQKWDEIYNGSLKALTSYFSEYFQFYADSTVPSNCGRMLVSKVYDGLSMKDKHQSYIYHIARTRKKVSSNNLVHFFRHYFHREIWDSFGGEIRYLLSAYPEYFTFKKKKKQICVAISKLWKPKPKSKAKQQKRNSRGVGPIHVHLTQQPVLQQSILRPLIIQQPVESVLYHQNTMWTPRPVLVPPFPMPRGPAPRHYIHEQSRKTTKDGSVAIKEEPEWQRWTSKDEKETSTHSKSRNDSDYVVKTSEAMDLIQRALEE